MNHRTLRIEILDNSNEKHTEEEIIEDGVYLTFDYKEYSNAIHMVEFWDISTDDTDKLSYRSICLI